MIDKSLLKSRIQVSNATSFNRYPSIFKEVGEIVDTKFDGNAEILSFGCSSGEEIQTLDLLYIENSILVGVDVDDACIGAAKANVAGKRNRVSFYTSSELPDRVVFDIVLALSVLCRWPDTQGKTNISELFSFRIFNEVCFELSKRVRLGGYLIVHNSNYYFEDSSSFRNFRVASPLDAIGFVERFDITGEAQINARRGYVVFQKCSEVGPSCLLHRGQSRY